VAWLCHSLSAWRGSVCGSVCAVEIAPGVRASLANCGALCVSVCPCVALWCAVCVRVALCCVCVVCVCVVVRAPCGVLCVVP
jgi:hypothetical protein